MKDCKYHPLAPASYRCSHCQMALCEHCVNHGEQGSKARCYLCDDDVIDLGASNKAEPFWRRFDAAFRYPMTGPCLTLIAALSLLEALVGQLPVPLVGLVLSLAITGMLLKYSFSCLQNTAAGAMTPPDISAAYGDGIALVFRLIAIIVVMAAAVFGVNRLLGGGIATLMAVLSVAVLPAVIILFAMTDNVLEAVHPANVLRLILSIGLPYGLLLAIIVMMSSSVAILAQFIGPGFTLVNQCLNALVANYYLVVTFHLMGYMLFQYQGELGYTAREHDEDSAPRDHKARYLAEIQLRLKEGQFDTVSTLFERALKALPNDNDLHSQYFEFLLASHAALSPKVAQRLSGFASRYLRFLNRSHRQDKLLNSYQRVLALLPDYVPNSPQLRLLLATASRHRGDPKRALKLLNGLHRQFPDFEGLVPAYQLMTDILEELPNMSTQAKKCRLLVEKLQRSPASTADA